MTPAATFCCLDCRLLQPPIVDCRECGSSQIAALAFAGDILRQPIKRQRGKLANSVVKGGITFGAISAYAGVVTAGALVSPVIPAVALGAMMGSLMVFARHRKRITTVPFLAPVTGEHAVTLRGTARKLTETITTCDGEAHVLAEEAVLRARGDAIYFRRTRGTRFVVDVEGGQRVVVDGLVRVMPPITRTPAKAGDPRLVALGIEGVPVAGQLDLAIVNDGDEVEITGEPVEDAVPELAFDRDAGQATVMCGRANAVVRVKLIGKA